MRRLLELMIMPSFNPKSIARIAFYISLTSLFLIVGREMLMAQEINAADTGGVTAQATGKKLFRKHCGLCHGWQGRGGMGVPLNLQSFLRVADKGYLTRSMINGRLGRGMPSFSTKLKSAELNAISIFVKSWQREPSLRLPMGSIEGDANRGKNLYRENCTLCHGDDAEGGKLPGDAHDIELIDYYTAIGGPALADPGFLKSASDGFLKATIMYGRAGTRMGAYLKGQSGSANLTTKEIDDIVAYIRAFE